MFPGDDVITDFGLAADGDLVLFMADDWPAYTETTDNVLQIPFAEGAVWRRLPVEGSIWPC